MIEGTGSTNAENTGSKCLSYKKLYHAALERGFTLQEQLEKCSSLLTKHHKITELKVCDVNGWPRVGQGGLSHSL